MVDDGGGDASHQRPPDAAETPAPHDYESGAQLLSKVDDCLIATFSDPKVGFFDTPSGLFDLLHLLVEHLLGFSLYRFGRLLIGLVAQAAFVYVVDGIRVPGRYGEVSWMDANGMLMEDYRPLLSATPNVANALKETLALLIKKPGMRWQLGETARRDVETKFSLTSWNLGLRRAFDRALGLSRASGEYE